MQQPAVATLLQSFQSSYALYSRKDTNSVVNYGLVLQIPADKITTIKNGDATLEQATQVLAPLIAQHALTTQLTFADGTYQSVPLRYVNIIDQDHAIDYAVVDNYVLIATSREGMATLIDTYKNSKPSLTAGLSWKSLFQSWGALPQMSDFIVGNITSPILLQLLPHDSTQTALPVAVAEQKDAQGNIKVQSALLLTK